MGDLNPLKPSAYVPEDECHVHNSRLQIVVPTNMLHEYQGVLLYPPPPPLILLLIQAVYFTMQTCSFSSSVMF